MLFTKRCFSTFKRLMFRKFVQEEAMLHFLLTIFFQKISELNRCFILKFEKERFPKNLLLSLDKQFETVSKVLIF